MNALPWRGYPDIDYRSEYTLRDGPDHMPRSAYVERIDRLRAHLDAEGVAGVLIVQPSNIVYLTGLFMHPTERPLALLIPTSASATPVFFIPRLDVDLVDTWWIREHEAYFDYPHTTNVWPASGPEADLNVWILERARSRVGEALPLAIDDTNSSLARSGRADVAWRDAGSYLRATRMVKSATEIALMDRAMSFGDVITEYAYHLIGQYGTDLRDVDVQRICSAYAEDLVYSSTGPLTGYPHSGTGTRVVVRCRAGRPTAYPHRNQVCRTRLAPGMCVHLAMDVVLGFMNGEYDRSWFVEPMDTLARDIWECHSEATKRQVSWSSGGVRVSEIAHKTLSFYAEHGMSSYVYHRPGHGLGIDEHEPPYIALGDHTVLQPGVCWSSEPGLYNPDGGYGFNHTNLVITEAGHGRTPNRWPVELGSSIFQF